MVLVTSVAPLDGLAQLQDGAWAALRDRLVTAGYVPALIAEAESIVPRWLDAVHLPAVDWWLERRASPAADLARLFAYGGRLSRASAERAAPA